MAARPRNHNISIQNLYCKLDKRNGKTYWQYKNPSTGEFVGFGTDAEAAKTAAAELNRMHAEQEVNQAFALMRMKAEKSSDKAAEMLLREWVKKYAQVLQRHVSKKELTEKTAGERQRIANRLANRLPRVTLSAVSARDLSAILAEYVSDDKTRMAQVVRAGWIDMFKEAQYAGVVDPGFNPAEATRKPKDEVKRQRLVLEDWQKIFAEAKTPHMENAMLLAIVTGQRLDDITNMQFSDIKNDMLHIEQGKYGARVAIPLSIRNNAINMSLREVIAKCRDRVLSKYLVHHVKNIAGVKSGDKLSNGGLSQAFSEARDRANIKTAEGKMPSTFHEQRSLSGRLYKTQGINVQALWGHKSAKTSDLYLDERKNEWIVVAI
ncbi:integrase [Enterobacterales bacterium CwR94]|nr:integrase [Enterobacterales bacterium CwR94]